MLIRCLVSASLAVLMLILPSGSAWACPDDVCANTSGGIGADVTVKAKDDPGQGTSPTTTPEDGSKRKKPACTYGDTPVQCVNEDGVWKQALQCRAFRLARPISEEAPYMGYTDGVVYGCRTPGTGGGTTGGGAGDGYFEYWVATAEEPDPTALVETAIERMHLEGAKIGATPLNDRPGVVGVPTWLWVQDPDDHSWGPITRTATAGDVSVTATAQVTGVTWSLGDGSTLTCDGPGTAWTRALGTGDSPTCGHRYTRPGDYTITATTHWRVDWAGAGESGTLTLDLDGTRDVTVIELHALVTS